MAKALRDVEGPFVAATDYQCAVPDLLSRWIPGRYVTLGTDGFGISETRQSLRDHFEVSAWHIARAALSALRDDGEISSHEMRQLQERLGVESAEGEAQPAPTSIA